MSDRPQRTCAKKGTEQRRKHQVELKKLDREIEEKLRGYDPVYTQAGYVRKEVCGGGSGGWPTGAPSGQLHYDSKDLG